MSAPAPRAIDLSPRRPLGSTGLEIAPVVLGTMQFGWTVSDVAALRILDAYAAAGGNLVDTANMYGGDQSIESFGPNRAHIGVSEDIVGRWLQTRGNRDRIVLTTKVRARMWDGDDGEGLNHRHILRAVDDSLRRLRTDHVDVLYAHWPDPAAHAEEWLATFGELIAAGKVRHAGSSNFCGFVEFGDLLTPLLALADSDPRTYPRIAVEQPRYNLLNRGEYEERLQSIALAEPLGIVTYSSLASGYLADKHRTATDADGRGAFLAQYDTREGRALLDELRTVAERHAAPVAAVALAWTLSQPGISGTLVGAETIEELAACAAAATLELDPDEVAELTRRSWWESRPEFVDW